MLKWARVSVVLFVVLFGSVSFAQVPTTIQSDINEDGVVDQKDLFVLMKSWHTGDLVIPTETPFITPTPTITPTPLIPTPTYPPVETITINLPGDVPLKMVRIPAGSFEMGRYPGEQDSNSREDPQHTVNIDYDFYMGQTEVTKAQWEAVMATTPWSGRSYVLDDPNSLAQYLSWYDCQDFITEINKLGQGTFRLPSESEWEYACRAGTTTRFYWGDDPDYTEIYAYAWYDGNAGDGGERYAHVVAQKLPNAFGLFDMSGNVTEWCQDWYHNSYFSAPNDGSAREVMSTNPVRVFRGAFWDNNPEQCRSAFRDYHTPNSNGSYIGFRLIREAL